MNHRKNQKGLAAVEFGLLLPVLLALAFGITEYGRAIYEYNTVTKAVRDATRYLSQYAPGTMHDIAANLVRHGNPGGTGPLLAPGLSSATVAVRDSSNDGGHQRQSITVGGVTTGVTDLVTVTVSDYRFNSLVSYVAPSVTFSPISTTMFQQANP